MKDQDQLLDLQTTDSFRLYLDEVGRHPLLTKQWMRLGGIRC